MDAERRERRRDGRRRVVVDAALRLLERGGEPALTMPGLAAELGVAVGGLYRTFASKDALVVGLQRRAIDELAALLEARVADAGPDAVARAKAAFGTWSAWAERSPALFALVDRALSDPARLLPDDDAHEVDRAMAPILTRCTALLAAATGPDDAALRTLAVWSAVRGARQLRKRDDRSPLRSAQVEGWLLEVLVRR